MLIEALTTKATPQTLIAHRETVRRLSDVYEQVNAPFGAFAMDTLAASTRAISSTDESAYNSIESSIESLTTSATRSRRKSKPRLVRRRSTDNHLTNSKRRLGSTRRKA